MTTKHKGNGAFGIAKIKRVDKWDGWDVVRDADGNVVGASRFDDWPDIAEGNDALSIL